MSDSTHFRCTCDESDEEQHIGHSAFNVEDILHIEAHRKDFTFETSDRQIEENSYTEGRYVTRGMQRGNRALKHDKQWRNSVQERSVLRYSTGG
jgi:hypothetical protein